MITLRKQFKSKLIRAFKEYKEPFGYIFVMSYSMFAIILADKFLIESCVLVVLGAVGLILIATYSEYADTSVWLTRALYLALSIICVLGCVLVLYFAWDFKDCYKGLGLFFFVTSIVFYIKSLKL